MKSVSFYIFISIVISIYAIINSYILFRGWQSLAGAGSIRWLLLGFFLTWALLFPAGRIIEKYQVCSFSDFCIQAGSLWLGYMLYITIFILLIDFIKIIDKIYNIIHFNIYNSGSYGFLIPAVTVFLASTVIVIYGYYNSVNTVYREETVTVSKPGLKVKKERFRIVMASDIHMGVIISDSHISRLVKMVNSKEPDLVLLAGDIIDEDLRPVMEKRLGESLREIRAKYGVYAVNGNHEHIGGAETAVRYLQEHGIKVIRDDFVIIDDSLVIAGREDFSSERFSGKKRKKLSDILAAVPRDKPLILLDHQPLNPDEGRKLGVDLQLSGHTHRGQMWPLNLITSLIFETDWGVKRKDGSVLIVSSGFGTWGPPVRTGSRSEIWLIDLIINK